MLNAFWQMSNRNKKSNSRIYDNNRKALSLYLSNLFKGKSVGPCPDARKLRLKEIMKGKNRYIRSTDLLKKYTDAKRNKMKAVERINKITGEIREYESINAARRDGFDQGTIIKCCQGKNKSYKGCYWQYLENNNDTR